MSSKELRQLEQCMDHLAYLFEELGVVKAEFAQGKVQFRHNGAPMNEILMNNLCQHISGIQRDELTAGEEDLPDYYFD